MKTRATLPAVCLLACALGGIADGALQSADIPFTGVVIDSSNPVDPHCKALGDINGDGQLDIIAASSAGGGMYWYEYPSWTKRAIRSTGSWTTDMQSADIDSDGDADLVIPNGSGLQWYRNPRPSGNPANGSEWTENLIDSQGANNHDVEVGDVNGDGRMDVVSRPKGGGATHVWLRSSTGGWSRVQASSRAGEGTGLGDIDNDGDLDILHNGFWVENTNGLGTAWSEHTIATNWPADVGATVDDVNGDGRKDVVLAPSESGGRLSWYESSSPRTGPWTEHVVDSTVSYIHTFKTADVDRDGDLDLVTAEMHQSGDPDEVTVYRNAGNGLSWAQQVVATSGSHNLRIGDIDNDGDTDIMGTNWNDGAPDSAVVRLWRNGLGAASSLDSWARRVVDAARPATAIFVYAADLDGDGRRDIVSGAGWYRNPGSAGGTWTRTAIGSPFNNVAAVYDFDGDGDLDLLGTQGVGSAANHSFAWARNGGNGTFTVLTNIATGGTGDFLQGIAVDRFTAGGPIEAALSWHNNGGGVHMLTVPANPSTGTWSFRTLSSTTQDEQLSSGDIDRDGDKDLLLGTRWLRNDGASWSVQTLFNTASSPDRNRLADINRDGRLDAVIGYEAISVPGVLAWYEQPATATSLWTQHVISSSVVGPMSLDVADFDGDSDLDVVVGEHNLSNPASARLLVFENRGTTWASHTVYTGDEHHDGAQAADIDGDGDLDIVSIGWGHNRVHLYENLAKSGGTPPSPPPVPTGLAATALSSSQINLSWTDASSNETEFRIFRSTSATTGFVQIGTVGANTTSFQNTGLAASTTYYYRVRAANSAGASGDSNTASATTSAGGGAGGVPPAGLQLWLKADAGITQSGGAVSAWADQSGNGRTASQASAGSRPTLVANALGGKPALAFDGTADHLTFTLPVNGWTGMTVILVSACAQDRTGGGTNAESAAVFWNETASWGTVYLSPFQTSVKFRFGTTQTGNLPSYARPASIGSSFSTTIAVKNGATDSLFVDGTQVVSQGGKLSSIAACRDIGNIGRGYDDTTYFPGTIAEVLVYNRALSTAERQDVEQYVQTRYSGAPPPNSPPSVSITSPASGSTFVAPATIAIAASASDTDGTVNKVEFFQGATKLGEDTSSAGGWTFSWAGVPAGSYSLTARATDNDSGVTTSSAVPVTVNAPGGGGGVPSSGLQLWLMADAGVTQSGGAVSAWADQSGSGRTAAQAAAAARPTLVAGAVGGKPAVQFDGTDDHLTFTLPINGWTGMTMVLVSCCTQDRTGGPVHAESSALFWNETASWGTAYLSPFQTNVKFRFGTTQTGNLPAYVRPSSIGSAFSTTIAVKSGATDSLYVNGALVLSQGGKLGSIAGCRDTGNLGRGYNDTTFFPGSIAEVLVYNRALSTTEREGVEDYLAARYPGGIPTPAVAGAPMLEVTVDSVSTGRSAVLSTASVGSFAYTDRSTRITGLAPGLEGGVLIRLANDDKGVTAADHLRLTVSQPAELFVGYDRRATTNPAWLNDGQWTITADLLAIEDAGASPMRVFRASVPAGPVVLGGNLAGGGDGAQTHYVLIVRAAGPPAPVKTGVTPGTWDHPGDSDGDGLQDGFEASHLLDPGAADSDGDGTPDESELAPDGRTFWEVQAGGAAAAVSGDSGGSGGCGLLGQEVVLLLMAGCLLRGRKGLAFIQ